MNTSSSAAADSVAAIRAAVAALGAQINSVVLLATRDIYRPHIQANGQSPRFAWFDGHNHVSTGQSLGSPQDDVGATLLSFFRAHL